MSLHTFASRSLFDENGRQEEERQRWPLASPQSVAVANYHSSGSESRAAALMLGFGTLAAVAYAGAQGVKAYNEYMAAGNESEPNKKQDDPTTDDNKQNMKADSNDQKEEKTSSSSSSSSSSSKKASDAKENIFKEWFGVGVGSKYYEGGFEETMTRREAALILGVRESSSAARIKDAHRKLLIMNHPDTGGSTYIAGKINEAKELLIKGKT
ncbi:hypothetical protein ACA910_007725 [Epithemia clementina (nom. ined.)]